MFFVLFFVLPPYSCSCSRCPVALLSAALSEQTTVMAQLFGNAAPNFRFSGFASSVTDGYALKYSQASRSAFLDDASSLPSGDSTNNNNIAFQEEGGADFDASLSHYVRLVDSAGARIMITFEEAESASPISGGFENFTALAVPPARAPSSNTVAGFAEVVVAGDPYTLVAMVETDGKVRLRPLALLPSGNATIKPFSISF